jgi:hypothetical protein
MINRSPGPLNTTSVVTTKLGRRTEWIRVPATSAPRASTGPCRPEGATVTAGARTCANVSASSREVPLGTSGLSSLA